MHLGTTVENVVGNSGTDGSAGSPLTGVLVRGDEGQREVPVRGLFYAIGHTPNTQLLQVRAAPAARTARARAPPGCRPGCLVSGMLPRMLPEPLLPWRRMQQSRLQRK